MLPFSPPIDETGYSNTGSYTHFCNTCDDVYRPNKDVSPDDPPCPECGWYKSHISAERYPPGLNATTWRKAIFFLNDHLSIDFPQLSLEDLEYCLITALTAGLLSLTAAGSTLSGAFDRACEIAKDLILVPVVEDLSAFQIRIVGLTSDRGKLLNRRLASIISYQSRGTPEEEKQLILDKKVGRFLVRIDGNKLKVKCSNLILSGREVTANNAEHRKVAKTSTRSPKKLTRALVTASFNADPSIVSDILFAPGLAVNSTITNVVSRRKCTLRYDIYGRSALFLAIWRCSPHSNADCVRLLLTHPGIDRNFRNTDIHPDEVQCRMPWFPLALAMRKGNIEILTMLMTDPPPFPAECPYPQPRPLDFTAVLDDSWTPLHYAAQNGHARCVQLFLERLREEEGKHKKRNKKMKKQAKPEICAVCSLPGNPPSHALKRCEQCRAVYYCSRTVSSTHNKYWSFFNRNSFLVTAE